MLKEPRWIFGFALLVMLASLAGVIALGKVEQQSSYGLDIVLSCVATLSGGFANWAFGQRNDSSKKDQ